MSDAEELRELLSTEGPAVRANTRGFNQRPQSTARLPDYERTKPEARSIKEDAVERLPALIDQLRATVEVNGGTVYLADDATDANRYAAEVVADRGASRVAKSKSMTSEEMFDVATSDVECCGMAGSFGDKSDDYDVSVATGEELAEQFTTDDTENRTVVASGTSCLDQLDHLLDRRSTHPVRLFARG